MNIAFDRRLRRPVWTLSLVLALTACAAPPTLPPHGTEAAPQPTPCPSGVPTGTRCLGGQDSAGAHYLIAVPAAWNQRLVLHAHGGPLLGAPRPERVAEDLQRWAVVVKAGYAWAGSRFRQGGVAVRATAEDTKRLRQIFVAHLGSQNARCCQQPPAPRRAGLSAVDGPARGQRHDASATGRAHA